MQVDIDLEFKKNHRIAVHIGRFTDADINRVPCGSVQ